MIQQIYTVTEVALILKYDPQTIRRFIRCGRIVAFKIGEGPKAPYRISESELQRVKDIGFEDSVKCIRNYFLNKDGV